VTRVVPNGHPLAPLSLRVWVSLRTPGPPGPRELASLREGHPDFAPVVRPLFEVADEGRIELVTSTVTLLEVLVVPYRAGDLTMAERYEAILSRGRGLTMVPLSRPVLRPAAHVRARYGPRTPDALQLAAALSGRCSAMITNDQRLPDLPSLPVIQLKDVT
jgi:predicted nucleic acid-binding protein